MRNFFKRIAQHASSTTFKRSFALILMAEAITIFVAWILLDFNVNRWLADRVDQAIKISAQAAKSSDWSLVDTLPKEIKSKRNGQYVRTEVITPLFNKYRAALNDLTERYFGDIEGDVYLVVIDNGREYRIDPFDPHPMDPFEQANRWEIAAYSSGKTEHMTVPYSDISGTYLAAYTPIFRDGKVVGLMAAEYDSATIGEFRELVRRAFWYSVLPGLILALAVAYILAAMFVDPMDVFRRIDESSVQAATDPAQSELLDKLSPREREVAEYVRRGLKNREIADALVVTPETVKKHLKNIKEKTGFTRVDLAVHVEASRRAPQELSAGA